MMSRPIRVLVVDDSALVRNILSQGLNLDPGIEVVGTASDPYQARDKIVQLRPDVLTLDVEMPRMDGVAFLRKLMPQYPLPVVMVSSLTQRGKQITIDALDAGAVDFVSKPTSNVASGLNAMIGELRVKVKIASSANVSHWKGKSIEARPQTLVGSKALAESTDKVIAIGASTGGTEAIRKVITKFPATTPGVVIVQHMPAGFTKMFSDRLNQLCAMEVKEATDGDRVRNGLILIAPGGMQMKVVRSGGFYHVKCGGTDKVSGHCPSVDVMMNSVAEQVGANAVGSMLTGMGGDGSDGMLAMRKAGARCVAQDEASCVVFGMPKVAFEKGGAERLVPLDSMAQSLLNLLTEK
ncbi:MAG: chemotaxis response regulator protein-glutamate methylesterase [Desulfuromonadales bacterium]|nr:chemotaxis response regulator protein-glutamate methylesterase [Desulfuromonadales bacterium]